MTAQSAWVELLLLNKGSGADFGHGDVGLGQQQLDPGGAAGARVVLPGLGGAGVVRHGPNPPPAALAFGRAPGVCSALRPQPPGNHPCPSTANSPNSSASSWRAPGPASCPTGGTGTTTTSSACPCGSALPSATRTTSSSTGSARKSP